MQIIKEKAELRMELSKFRQQGLTIGFVPTMGYLHEGHLTLMKTARKENDRVVVSIFVNPTQFGPNEDFATYPRDLERDAALAQSAGVDIIFAPEVEQMYARDADAFVDIHQLSQNLCGARRPGHFRGVCTIVMKLFNIVQPDRAYFGQKDAQQVIIIQKMVEDLDIPVSVKTVPTVREIDGLAMSSRNKYLNPVEREAALALNHSLRLAKDRITAGERDAGVLRKAIIEMITAEPLARIDYVSIVSMKTLQDIETVAGPILIALAVFIGKTRLIDNLMLEVE